MHSLRFLKYCIKRIRCKDCEVSWYPLEFHTRDDRLACLARPRPCRSARSPDPRVAACSSGWLPGGLEMAAGRPQLLPAVVAAAPCGGGDVGRTSPADATCSGRDAVSRRTLPRERSAASRVIARSAIGPLQRCVLPTPLRRLQGGGGRGKLPRPARV